MNKLLIPILAAALFCVGCAHLESNAYKTIGGTSIAVDGAMNGWGDYVRAGLATPADEQRVREVYGSYQRAMSAAKIAVATAKSVPEGASKLEYALQIVGATSGDLIKLVTDLTTKKP